MPADDVRKLDAKEGVMRRWLQQARRRDTESRPVPDSRDEELDHLSPELELLEAENARLRGERPDSPPTRVGGDSRSTRD